MMESLKKQGKAPVLHVKERVALFNMPAAGLAAKEFLE